MKIDFSIETTITSIVSGVKESTGPMVTKCNEENNRWKLLLEDLKEKDTIIGKMRFFTDQEFDDMLTYYGDKRNTPQTNEQIAKVKDDLNFILLNRISSLGNSGKLASINIEINNWSNVVTDQVSLDSGSASVLFPADNTQARRLSSESLGNPSSSKPVDETRRFSETLSDDEAAPPTNRELRQGVSFSPVIQFFDGSNRTQSLLYDEASIKGELIAASGRTSDTNTLPSSSTDKLVSRSSKYSAKPSANLDLSSLRANNQNGSNEASPQRNPSTRSYSINRRKYEEKHRKSSKNN